MAERGSREGSTRRQSFRKSLAEAGLPTEYLDALEQKRKQLDESIHKYIAAKERDYKSYEKDLRQQYSLAQDKEREGGKTRRTSSESTAELAESPRISGQQQQQQHHDAIDVLLSAGLRREHIGQPVAVAVREHSNGVPSTIETKSVAGLTDQRANVDRDKEFVGVFTPAFLPALEEKSRDQVHVGSAPAGNSSPRKARAQTEHGVQRANSDSLVDSNGQRPAHLQLVQRTSSSGSSVDGKLASALKSPTQQRPKRKRVSLAVGDTIVAPSDNVPVTMSSNSTASHSRTRSPAATERESKPNKAIESLRSVQSQASTASLPSKLTTPIPNGAIIHDTESKLQDSKTKSLESQFVDEKRELKSALPIEPSAPPRYTSLPKVDPDGDLFELEDDEESQGQISDALESEDEITGRVDIDGEVYDPNAGLIPEPCDSHNHAEHVEFVPGSANASQQPTNPGFRRPSVTSDPRYIGTNYAEVEHDAVVDDVYGSSYARPSKGSFTTGSLGESFMARNAEMIRNRGSQESAQIRS